MNQRVVHFLTKLREKKPKSLIPSRNKWSIQTCIVSQSRSMISISATIAVVTPGVDDVMNSSMDEIFLQVVRETI